MFRFILSEYYFSTPEMSPTTETRMIDDQVEIMVAAFVKARDKKAELPVVFKLNISVSFAMQNNYEVYY